ncbi:MAG TPA: 16S rRNA (cytosine(967)-C(5))-methyltransferase RsmB [Vicinamibacterales bacterium]|nr:16S rRNA (cytosine(967)-C(5))-methyltransferase RsmB [Vicinamibacterales bacterium]
MTAPARRAAFDVLRAVDAGRLDLGAALARARARLTDDRDRALANQLAIGTLRWQGQVDHVIASFSNRPLPRLDRDVLVIVRLAVYQLLHLDRVPAAAVVDDAVQQTRKAGKASAAGFVNAVLRSIARRRHALPLPRRPEDVREREPALAYLTIALSHPAWLVERWLDRWGFERVEAWLQFNNAEAPLTIRANTLEITRDGLAARLAAEGVSTRPTEWAPHGLVPVDGNPLRTTLAEAGLFFVQDEASQLVPLLAGVRPGMRILDACAAPGGKTAAMAGDAEGRAEIVAGDVRPARVALLQRTLAQLRVRDVSIVQMDAQQALPFTACFDVVLLDAPCSGLGTLRRDPEIRWRRQPEQLPVFASAQLRMLEHAAAAVKPGGRLVYATCSSEPEENEEVMEAFLRTHSAFRPLDPAAVRALLPGRAASLVNEHGHLRTWPFEHGLEAFFGAVLVRQG